MRFVQQHSKDPFGKMKRNHLTMKTLRLVCLVAAAAMPFMQTPPAFAQGSLTPPGAPAPTMKRLDEIEPRLNLQASPAPAGVDTTDANYHFIINQPGSYYLSANLGVTKANGIKVNVEGVSLDLNGFEISRANALGGNGIEIVATAHRTSLRHGSIKGFLYGINTVGSASACSFRELRVGSCIGVGIVAGPSAVLDSCRAHDNFQQGIIVGNSASLNNCTVTRNAGSAGLQTGSGATLTNCTATLNIGQDAILAGDGSSISNCSAFNNNGGTSNGITAGPGSTVTACSSSNNGGSGFNLGTGGTIQKCAASFNRGDGITLSSGAAARDNDCVSNRGSGGNSAGIHVTGSDNRIDGNNVVNNDHGVDVDAANNLIVRNSARRNTTNYDIVANNVYGGIVDRTAPASAAVNGNSATTSAGTLDPWANVSY